MSNTYNFEDNEKQIGILSNEYKRDNQFVFFKPNVSNIEDVDINTCFTPDSGTSSLNMVKVDELLGTKASLYTKETCKLNAILVNKNAHKTQPNVDKYKTPGLTVTVLPEYYANNVRFFIGKVSYNNSTDDLTNIEAATANDKNVNEPKLSVEWTGLFKPNVTGIWEFGISTTGSSFLWIGDNAVNDYTAQNSFINIDGTNQNISITKNSFFKANMAYPIRMQYGHSGGDNKFNLSVTSPDKITKSLKNSGLFYTSFDPLMTYYALSEQSTEMTNRGLFDCYVTDPEKKVDTYNQLRSQENQYNYKIIWRAVTDNLPKLNSSNYLAMDNNNNLNIYDSENRIVKTLGNTTTGQIQLSDINGDLLIERTNGNWANLTQLPTNVESISNNVWATKYNNIQNKKILEKPVENTTIGTKVVNNGNGPILISNYNKYALEFSAQGNLIIKMTTKGCNGSTNEFKYTSLTDNNNGQSYYPYRLGSTSLFNELYLAHDDKTQPTLTKVSNKEENVAPNNTYTEYKNIYPMDTSKSVDVNKLSKTCKTACTDDPKCKNYYNYVENGREFCLLNNDSDLPKSFLPKQPNSNISTSTLYIREFDMSFNKSNLRSMLDKRNIDDYKPFDNYELIGSNVNSLDGNNQENKMSKLLDIRRKFLPESFTVKEGLENYLTGNDFDTKYHYYTTPAAGVTLTDVTRDSANVAAGGGILTGILQRKIAPLEQTAKENAAILRKIDEKNAQLPDKINSINTLRTVLTTDPKYKNDYNADAELLYKNKKPSKIDAMQEDIETMLLRQNEIFMLGSITVATLLIAAIYIGR